MIPLRALAFLLILAFAGTVVAQNLEATPVAGQMAPMTADKPSGDNGNEDLARLFAADQKTLWTAPFRIKTSALPRIFVTAGMTSLLVGADTKIQSRVGNTHQDFSRKVSDGGIALFAGAAGTFYGVGLVTRNEHARETGRLASEAAINALAMNSVLQLGFRRGRPGDANAGDFFSGGTSFPSSHSAVAWATATVIAHEYPGWGTKLLSYGLASTVSLARVGANKHYASDAFLGSALGMFVGDQIYRLRHDKNLPGESWGTFNTGVERLPDPMHNASPYVPLDSWVYPALNRLAMLGKAPGGFLAARPWTRLECARIVKEAVSNAKSDAATDAETTLFSELEFEFAEELRILDGGSNRQARVESLYTRSTEIAGPPLTDSYHFAQTIANDYGRPYRQGFNSISGMSVDAEAGPLVVYVRGEYQHAPGSAALSDAVRTAIANNDTLPIAPPTPYNDVNRFRLIDAYGALNLSGWQASFGKQNFWWGPDSGGDLVLSNNAEGVYSFAFSRVAPLTLPTPLKYLGDVRPSFFLGQLQGYQFLRLTQSMVLYGSYDQPIDPQPYIWGFKVSVQPTPNLQLGASMTSVFSGYGRPLTLKTFRHTFSASGNGQPLEPGDRRTTFDFSYRIPGLRNWLVLYNGSMAEDEPSPLAYPRRSAMNPGIYLPQIPKLSRLDFRAEGVYTNVPNTPLKAFAYTNSHYANGYTNYGQLIGHTIGPQGSGFQLWSTYWFSTKQKLQLGFRREWVDPTFLGGGGLVDFSGRFDMPIGRQLSVSSVVQYERWKFPVLANGPNSNVAASLQLTYEPKWTHRGGSRNK